MTIDFKSVSYAVDALQQVRDKPFLLACGIFKPHSPFFAPPKYHARYKESPAMPERKEDDWNDLPAGAATLMAPKRWFWKGMEKLEARQPGSYQRFVQSYAACCTS